MKQFSRTYPAQLVPPAQRMQEEPMFGRRRRDEADQVDESVDGAVDTVDDADEVDAVEFVPVDGPWDSGDADRPSQAPEGWGVLDLGALVLTLPVEAEVRMDVDEQTQAVNAVAVQYADSVMQLMPYAGPRSSAIWPDVRNEIARNITAGGGTVEERPGPMGIELRAVVPADQGQRLPARFMGIDGPRWFLRAVVTGTGAHDDAEMDAILQVLRQVVVVRDDQARPLQEPLPVRLPQDVAGAPLDTPTSTKLNRFERGPEITEIH